MTIETGKQPLFDRCTGVECVVDKMGAVVCDG